MPANDRAGFHDEYARLPILPDRAEPNPQESIRHGHVQIKQDDQAETTTKDRVIRWVVIVVVCLLVLAGFYFAVRMLE